MIRKIKIHPAELTRGWARPTNEATSLVNWVRTSRSADGLDCLSLAFIRALQNRPKQAQHLYMTPSKMKYQPSDGAMRAAKQIERNSSLVGTTAELIDRETGLRELLEILEGLLGQAGDLIEGRSPELAARAA